jgi:glycerol-3-phosphate acyltransferase PlsY
MHHLLALVVGYLCGSIPFGLLFTRLAGLGDVRSIGSGNIGATNVLRTGNKKVAALTLVFDALKGTLPVVAMTAFGGSTAGILAGFGALAGHIFPIWLKFKGGKGVATNIGVLFGLYWPLGLLFLATWLVLAVLFRISSLSALVATLVTPLWCYLLGETELIVPTLVIAAVIWVMHHQNIARLMKGEESRISLSRKS